MLEVYVAVGLEVSSMSPLTKDCRVDSWTSVVAALSPLRKDPLLKTVPTPPALLQRAPHPVLADYLIADPRPLPPPRCSAAVLVGPFRLTM